MEKFPSAKLEKSDNEDHFPQNLYYHSRSEALENIMEEPMSGKRAKKGKDFIISDDKQDNCPPRLRFVSKSEDMKIPDTFPSATFAPWHVEQSKKGCVKIPEEVHRKMDIDNTEYWTKILENINWKKDSVKIEEITKTPENVKWEDDIGNIGETVKEHALHFLPAKSLYKFRSVSKQWNKWIESPFFAHQQSAYFKYVSGLLCQVPGESPSFISLDRASSGIPSDSLSFLPEPVEIRTSCNGLLCCQGRIKDQAYYICNPVTKEWKMLPMPQLYHGPGSALVLAFDPSLLNFTARYELVCAVILPDVPILMFEIYSSTTNSWRTSETLYCDINSAGLVGDGLYVNGFAYWVTYSGVVLGFHVSYEHFGTFNLPPCSGLTSGVLTEMHGGLFYLLSRKQGEEHNVEVYGDMSMDLKEVISLNLKQIGNVLLQIRILSFVNDETLILDVGGRIVAYNVRSHEFECLAEVDNAGFCKYLPYVNSIVPVTCSAAAEWYN
ncbi:F-box protein At5g07610-like [Mercurialis annua]|uniref:F-box protein At5g07610-like n=1 Tax=Mercurialis annua TaxID=3986 RepID=UPI00215F9A51|nr:F-box protein At5g07610-like [Mercurialis annua]